MTRVNIWMDEDTHKKLKIMSTLKDMTIQDYIEHSVKSKIEKDIKLIEELVE